MRISAVDRERRAGHEPGRGQEDRRVRRVPHFADPPERVDRRQRVGVLDQRRPDDTRCERVHADVVARQLRGKRHRQRMDAALARHRGGYRDAGHPLLDERGADVDDRAALAFDHERDDCLRDQVRALHVRLEEALQVLRGALEEGFRGEDAGVVHEAGPAGQERAGHVEPDAASSSGDDHAVDAIAHVMSPFAFTRTAVDENKKMVCGHRLHNLWFCIVGRMTYDQLVAFTSVAAEGTFTGASSALHKSQPAVSKLIRNLEGELGVVLFDRTRYRATLTDAGRVFYERAAAVVESTHALRGFGLALGGKIEPIVRLAVEAVTPLETIVKILRDVETRFPSVRFELHTERLAGVAA